MPADRDGPVAGVVLAAGSSSRFGRNKLLLDLDGEPLVRRTVKRAEVASLSPVIVVVGFEADQVLAALEGLPLHRVRNPEFRTGIHTSLARGIGAVPGACVAAVVVLADMPLVTTAMCEALVDRFRNGTEPLVLTRYGEVQAPPTLYARSLFPALVAAGEEGGREVVRAHGHEAAALVWPADLLADVDRPEDLARIHSMEGSWPPPS